MKSYLFLKTLNKTSKHLIDNVNRRYEHLFLEGNTVYGWYEAIIELDTSREQLRGIVEDLKRSEPDILHIGIAVAKAPS